MCKQGAEACAAGDQCRYAHTQFEIDYHPLKYKGEVCRYATEADGFSCNYMGNRCFAAHSKEDLRNVPDICSKLVANAQTKSVLGQASREDDELSVSVRAESIPEIPAAAAELTEFALATFKTLPCHKPRCDNVYKCMYYHNRLERRRNCDQYRYQAKMCPQVFVGQRFSDPSDCPYGDACPMCHTKNELYYHPLRFRTRSCARSPCPYGEYCPDKHLEMIEEREELQEDPQQTKELAKERRMLKEKCEHLEEKLVS